MDFEAQKGQMIEMGEKQYTRGAAKDIAQHLQGLRQEFSGESELNFTHAKLIVLLRREYKTEVHFRIFEGLWSEHGDYLCKSLSMRWLVSAADTFSDHAEDPGVKAAAVAIAILVKTIRIQETERYYLHADRNEDDPERLQLLQDQRLPLFGGISALAVGTDDTLRNLRWRIESLQEIVPVGPILLEIFQRIQEYDTVYKRMRDRHTRDRTAWW